MAEFAYIVAAHHCLPSPRCGRASVPHRPACCAGLESADSSACHGATIRVSQEGEPAMDRELQAIQQQGAAARKADASYFGNPHLFAQVPIDTPDQLIAWSDLCNAWSAGWLQEDAGRDESIQRLMQLRYW
jgi:hypothetical protein